MPFGDVKLKLGSVQGRSSETGWLRLLISKVKEAYIDCNT